MNSLIVIAGPTGVGKTALSIGLAQKIDGAIISADSMQVYRGMDIGSAKIRPQEMGGIDHYLIDIADPKDPWNVVLFQEKAKEALKKIYAKGQIPILVGGTGFYIQALVKDIDFQSQVEDAAFRAQMEEYAKKEGAQALHAILAEKDPDAAAAIHANNIKRVIRALEYYHISGHPISAHNAREEEKKSPYRLAYFVLTQNRARLYQRIDQRVDEMMKEGLLDEVRTLRAQGCRRDMVSMKGLGYQEILTYLEGEDNLEGSVEKIKRNSRHFAKRQLTWFRREEDAIWLDKDHFANDPSALLEEVLRILKEKEIYG